MEVDPWLTGLASLFEEHLMGQALVDVTFICPDGKVCGHRLILSLASEYLNHLISSNSENHLSEVVIIVPDFSIYDIWKFLSAIYSGRLPKDISAFRNVVKLFGISIFSDLEFANEEEDPKTSFMSEFEQYSKHATEFKRLSSSFRTSSPKEPIIRQTSSSSSESDGGTNSSTSTSSLSMFEQSRRYFVRNLPANAELLQLPRNPPAPQPPKEPLFIQIPPDFFPEDEFLPEQTVSQGNVGQDKPLVVKDDSGYQGSRLLYHDSESQVPGVRALPVQQEHQTSMNQLIISDQQKIDSDQRAVKDLDNELRSANRPKPVNLSDPPNENRTSDGDPILKSVETDKSKMFWCCYICGEYAQTQEGLRNHMRIFHGDGKQSKTSGKPLKRTLDPTKASDDSPSKNEPIPKVSKSDIVEHRCSYCKKVLITKSGLEIHIRSEHNKIDKPFYCSECPMKFQQIFELKTHLMSHKKDEKSVSSHVALPQDLSTKPQSRI